MISFTCSLVALLLGYLLYGKLVTRLFGISPDRPTPCYTKADGVDYMPMPNWKVFLIQFLNIAGTGPIFGAIMGILFGPAAYLWIVFGCIFAGAVHDYLCGMISIRKGGASVPEMVGDELGSTVRVVMRVCSIVLLILVGAVFTRTPADLLASMTAGWGWTSPELWITVIFVYYLLATLLPINALIGKIYPLFGIALLVMAVGVGVGIYTHSGHLPELTEPLTGNHPAGQPVFPMLCITIACGAISGFHSTQTPMMARCIKNERYGRRIFYGAMIAEGVVALIWAGAAIKFASLLPGVGEGRTAYQALADMGTPAVVVGTICKGWLGTVGAVLAVLGVVAAPVTSGDTAFRSARLIATESLHIRRNNILTRLLVCLPFFAIAVGLMFVDFNILWRYFGWFNQTLATIMLWTAAVWMARRGKCYWLPFVPALFMTVVCASYILVADEGFSIPLRIGLSIGVALMLCLGVFFMLSLKRLRNNH
ncbi:MAG: carbon starvation protein A [Prevotellaceae bacterium]|nr:carbon starvation protein A [Prevotellaceae bacterium]